MRTVVVVLGVLVFGTAQAAPRAIEGHVTAASARWTADGTRIVTDATVRTPDGDVVVSQLGGSADGFTMRVFHGPEQLVPGMRVAIAATEARDLARRMHVVVDSVRVMQYPPGFVRTGPTERGNFLFWRSGCVFVTPDSAGTNQVVGNNELEAIQAAVGEWNSEVAGCSYMEIRLQPGEAAEVGRDGRNLIKFRDSSWCRPATNDDPPRCHSPSAAGLTTAVFVDDPDSDRDGEIVDADIELNGEHFAIAHEGQSLGTEPCQSEIGNTLTHELGHLLGLEHPCRAAGDPDRVDDAGRAVPLCVQTTDPDIVEATMYNFQDCGESKKASLAPDDIQGVCGVYASADDPGVCEAVSTEPSGCCQASAGEPPPILIGLVVGGLLFRRKTRR